MAVRSEFQTNYALLELKTKSKLRKRLSPEFLKSQKKNIVILFLVQKLLFSSTESHYQNNSNESLQNKNL